MKTLSLIILFCFCSNVFAQTNPDLLSAFDEYNYSMNVEWDQKDLTYYEAQTQLFFSSLEKMLNSGMITKEDIVKLVEAKIQNAEALEAIQLKLSLLPEANSSEELVQVLKENASSFYSKGASWSGSIDGDTVFFVGMGLIVVAALAYTIWHEVNYQCVSYSFRNKVGCKSTNCYEKYCTEWIPR